MQVLENDEIDSNTLKSLTYELTDLSYISLRYLNNPNRYPPHTSLEIEDSDEDSFEYNKKRITLWKRLLFDHIVQTVNSEDFVYNLYIFQIDYSDYFFSKNALPLIYSSIIANNHSTGFFSDTKQSLSFDFNIYDLDSLSNIEKDEYGYMIYFEGSYTLSYITTETYDGEASERSGKTTFKNSIRAYNKPIHKNAIYKKCDNSQDYFTGDYLKRYNYFIIEKI